MPAQHAATVLGQDEDAGLVGLFLLAVPMHGDEALRLHIGHIGTVRTVDSDAHAAADVTDDGVPRQRVAALGKKRMSTPSQPEMPTPSLLRLAASLLSLMVGVAGSAAAALSGCRTA